jgi:hypothetical protein
MNRLNLGLRKRLILTFGLAPILLACGRSKFHLALLLAPTGKLGVDPTLSPASRQPSPLKERVLAAQTKGLAGRLVMLDGQAYQMAIVPV